MYLTRGTSYYTPDGEQHRTRGPFLILASGADTRLYACVRQVAMRQCGNFMMGVARIGGHSVVVSGTYGSDGLPLDWDTFTPEVRTKFVQVPADLAKTFWADNGGHNTAGMTSGPVMRTYGNRLIHGRGRGRSDG